MTRPLLCRAALLALLSGFAACADPDDASSTPDGDAGTQSQSPVTSPTSDAAASSPLMERDGATSGSTPTDAGAARPADAGGSSPLDAQTGAGSDGGPSPGDAAVSDALSPQGPCSDTCPVKAGFAVACKLRFMYGLNYAWHAFGADFGGIRAWNQPGVSAEPAVASELKAMAANGVQVLRWWLWPDFRGDGVSFDANDVPTGLGGTARADLARALELAEQNDMYLMLTLFSFDNFRPTRTDSNLRIRGIKPLVVDDAKRRALMDAVVAPIARAAADSPHARRLLAWDIINEPEWAISGASLYGGDPAFDPQTNLESVSHAQMETFLRDVRDALRANSKAPITVGATAFKWRSAWSMLDLDFHQFHMYDWINMYWPYNRAPMAYGLSDKPVVMGEFPMTGLTGVNYATLLQSWFSNQYAGALGWAYTDPMFSGNRDLSQVKAFSSAHACETRY